MAIGRYYDGLSAAVKNVTLNIDPSDSSLHICFDKEVVVWSISKLKAQKYSGILEVRHEEFEGALLTIADKDFSDILYRSLKSENRIGLHTRLVSLGLIKLLGVLIICLGCLIAAYFYLLPPIAEKAAVLIPESFDTEMGNRVEQDFLNSETVDEKKTLYLQEFVDQLQLNNSKPIKVSVVKSKDVNAFALPNGRIVVYSAIIDNMKGHDELAALIAHEVSHVNGRHSVRALCRNLAGYLSVSVIFGDINGVIAVVAENAQMLHSLSYSRDLEQEADEKGLELLFNNHVNPFGAVKLFKQLERESEHNVPKILSTHPLTQDRYKNMNRIISEREYVVKPDPKLALLFKKLQSR